MFSKEYVLECLNKYCHFNGRDLCEQNFEDLVVCPLREADFEFYWANGVTKGVIIPLMCNFVIKIPFYGEEDCSGYEDGLEDYEEIQARYGDDWSSRVPIFEVYPFSGAWSDEGWNYCEAEARMYKGAEEEGLEYLFAKTEKIGEVCGWPVYCQDRAEMLNDLEMGEQNPQEDSIDRARDIRDQDEAYCQASSFWIATLLEEYDEDTYWQLSEFCKKYGVSDLHDGNVGYINGVPVLVDYSSFDG
jgi:hypothetical protein